MNTASEVLIIHETGNLGGTLSFLSRILEIHSKNNISRSVLISQNQINLPLTELFKKYDTRFILGPNRSWLFRKLYLSLIFDLFFSIKVIRQIKPKLILVSTTAPWGMLGVILFRIPVAFMIHTYPLKKSIKHFGMRLFIKFFSKKVLFLSVSQYSCDQIKICMNIPEHKIRLLRNSCERPLHVAKKTSGHPPRIMTAAHIMTYRQPDLWLEIVSKVVKEIPDAKFLWAGQGDALEHLKTKVKEKKLDHFIELPGEISFEQVIQELQKSAVYLHISTIESQGIGVAEAMLQCLPCVVSKVGGLQESVEHEKTGFLCELQDTNAYVHFIIKLLKDKNLNEKMGYEGKKKAERMFSKQEQEARLLKIYEELGF